MAEEEFMATVEEEREERDISEVVYVCAGCGKEYTYQEIVEASIGFKCANCGSRIFYKPRPRRRPRKVYAV